ncbi:class I SAM-dependent methyltransferase [Paenibacillus sp. J2TS4]|uniref:class I SAM-dependent methyltransferase n=1 Tax=Paenibacillus sp. J2TS4 TaxID=2807194 RepID=UPI001B2C526A|nr:class I SAM-dependent methyltransferase [Paenibacillus sp. J2TS4]GIP36042.1 methyltransferase [Paenibacillus sp. J2TS4]
MNSKERFSNRVDSYVKYRPSYPQEAIQYLYDTAGLPANGEVADIGAGTGIFSELLLERGCKVTAVEPNKEMREAAEERLVGEPYFRIMPGSAEETGLPDRSVDFIVCAQSFHWFDRTAARVEFRRILRPGGKAALIWNSRLTHGTPFREEYERLLQTFGTDYKSDKDRDISPESLASFFKPGAMQEARFTNQQVFDFEGLRGRLHSSSSSLVPGDPNYENMVNELQSLFDRNNENGQVVIDYETRVIWGEV